MQWIFESSCVKYERKPADREKGFVMDMNRKMQLPFLSDKILYFAGKVHILHVVDDDINKIFFEF